MLRTAEHFRRSDLHDAFPRRAKSEALMRPVTQSGHSSRSSHANLRVLRAPATKTAPHNVVAPSPLKRAAAALRSIFAVSMAARERAVMGTAAIVCPLGIAANLLYMLAAAP